MSEEAYKPNSVEGNHLSVQPVTRKDQASHFSQKYHMKAVLLVYSCTLHGFSRFNKTFGFVVLPYPPAGGEEGHLTL